MYPESEIYPEYSVFLNFYKITGLASSRIKCCRINNFTLNFINLLCIFIVIMFKCIARYVQFNHNCGNQFHMLILNPGRVEKKQEIHVII